MALPFDPAAQRKKYAMLKFQRSWNVKNPGHQIIEPAGFDPETDVIGTPAREFVKNLQRETRLLVTGRFDHATMRMILPPGIRSEVMALAHTQLGMHEWPPSSNMGEIVKYLNSVGLGGGYPWCAAFVTWVLKHEGFNRFPPNPAYVPSYHGWAKSKGLLKPVSDSKLGDMWIWWRDQHVGFCDDTNPKDIIAYGLDGNVGAYGGSVTQVRRTSGEVTACIDLVKMKALK